MQAFQLEVMEDEEATDNTKMQMKNLSYGKVMQNYEDKSTVGRNQE